MGRLRCVNILSIVVWSKIFRIQGWTGLEMLWNWRLSFIDAKSGRGEPAPMNAKIHEKKLMVSLNSHFLDHLWHFLHFMHEIGKKFCLYKVKGAWMRKFIKKLAILLNSHFFSSFMTFFAFYARKGLKKGVFKSIGWWFALNRTPNSHLNFLGLRQNSFFSSQNRKIGRMKDLGWKIGRNWKRSGASCFPFDTRIRAVEPLRIADAITVSSLICVSLDDRIGKTELFFCNLFVQFLHLIRKG